MSDIHSMNAGPRSQYYRNPREIDQPVYSRITYEPKIRCIDDDWLYFYGFSRGSIDPEKNTVTWLKTNIEGVSTLGGVMHKITAFAFYFHPASQALLDHFVKYAYFNFRICDQDFIHQPFMTMVRYHRFFRKELTIPVTICPYENFMVSISLAKSWKKSFDIISELVGVRRRPE